jgi:hypothetical protein
MPHQSFKVLPGVDQNKTLALNEAAISISQLIRFIPDRTMGGLVQKLGGWSKYFPNTINSIVRCLWAWEDTNANSYLGVGAEGAPAGGGGALQVSSSSGFLKPLKLKSNIPPVEAVGAGEVLGATAWGCGDGLCGVVTLSAMAWTPLRLITPPMPPTTNKTMSLSILANAWSIGAIDFKG